MLGSGLHSHPLSVRIHTLLPEQQTKASPLPLSSSVLTQAKREGIWKSTLIFQPRFTH